MYARTVETTRRVSTVTDANLVTIVPLERTSMRQMFVILASATTSIQRGTVKRARAAVNVVSSSLHLTVTVVVLATLAILNVDLVNVI